MMTSNLCDRNHKIGSNSVFNCEDLFVAGGQKKACAYCVLEWRRELRPIEPGDKFFLFYEWTVKYAQKVIKDSPENIAAFQKTLYNHVRNRIGDIDREISYGVTTREEEKRILLERYGDKL